MPQSPNILPTGTNTFVDLAGNKESLESLPTRSHMASPRQRSAETIARIRIKNRRKRYLDLHPEYFSSSLELAGLP